MRILPRKSLKKTQKIFYRINERIQAPEVRVVDEDGKNLGVFPTVEALRLAQERELDLIEVNPKAVPPIAKILDYGKFLYQREKEVRKQKAKQKKVEIKGIRLSFRISPHDQEMRLAQAEKFLKEDNKVKIEIILKGRERQYTNTAKESINKFVESLGNLIEIKIEQPLSVQGRRLSVIVTKR